MGISLALSPLGIPPTAPDPPLLSPSLMSEETVSTQWRTASTVLQLCGIKYFEKHLAQVGSVWGRESLGITGPHSMPTDHSHQPQAQEGAQSSGR